MDAGVDRGMVARILAYLFGLGGLLLLATLLLPDSEQRQTAELCAIAGAAILVAIGLILGYDRLPVAFLQFAPFMGIVLVGLVIYFADPVDSAAYAHVPRLGAGRRGAVPRSAADPDPWSARDRASTRRPSWRAIRSAPRSRRRSR